MNIPRPTQPFQPSRLNVFPVRNRRSKDRASGRPKTVYRFRVEVDGWQWQKTFDRKGHADAYARRMTDGYARGWFFDPGTVAMIDPDTQAHGDDATATVFATTLEYVRSGWSSWRPNTRRHYVRYLSRARRWLLRPEAPVPDDGLAAELDRYVQQVSLRLSLEGEGDTTIYREAVPAELAAAARWLETWSIPVEDVDATAIRRLIARYDYHVPKHRADQPPPQPVRSKPSTRAAMSRHTKTWWNWLRDSGQVTHDPFRAARRPAQARAATRAVQAPVDPDIVLSPVHLFQLAAHIGAAHPVGDRWYIYAPLLGLAALRPGEGLGLRRRCFELPPPFARAGSGG